MTLELPRLEEKLSGSRAACIDRNRNIDMRLSRYHLRACVRNMLTLETGNLETEVEYSVLHRDEGQPGSPNISWLETIWGVIKVPMVKSSSTISRLKLVTLRFMVSGAGIETGLH